MPAARPEVLIVAGPDSGKRAVLMTDTVTFGRSAACDIQVQEQATSRHQLTFSAGPDGWIVENVSSQVVRVNGKKYKTGRKVIVETGDVLQVGAATEVLFVSAGDDPEQALRAYRQDRPEPVAQVMPVETVAETPPPPARPGPAAPVMLVEEPAAPVLESVDDEPVADSDADILAQRRKKLIKYGIGAGIYGVALIALILFLASQTRDDSDEVRGEMPPEFRKERIREVLSADLDGRDRNNPVKADRYLELAREHFVAWTNRPADLYRCVKYYKLCKAYGSVRRFGPEDELQYRNALSALVDRVASTYINGYANSRNRNWDRAREEFNRVLEMLPVMDDPEPEEDHAIWKNVTAHLGYVNRQADSRRRR